MELKVFNPNPWPWVGPVPFTMPGQFGPLRAQLGLRWLPIQDEGVQFARSFSRRLLPPITIEPFATLTLPIESAIMSVPTSFPTLPDRPIVTLTTAKTGNVPLDLSVLSDRLTLETHHVARVGNMVWEVWVRHLSDVIAEWELLIVASDPRVTTLEFALDEISIGGAAGWVPFCPHLNNRPQLSQDGNYHLALSQPMPMGDSQGIGWRGVLIKDPPAHAINGAPASLPLAVCSAWRGGYGPLPRALTPEILTSPVVREAENLVRVYLENRVDPRLGLQPNGNSTGSQRDFGIDGGIGALCHPGYLLPMTHSALSEARRLGHFREVDGTPVNPFGHPDHVTWDGYTHWSTSVSSDRLGKAPGNPSSSSTQGYGGPDREHWSINNLTAAACLTGSYLLQRLLERHGRHVLSGETLDPRLSTSHSGAPRGIGRTLQMAEQLRLSLHDASLCGSVETRIEHRINDIILREVLINTNQAYGTCLGTIQDNRAMGENVSAVAIWQESLGILGLACGWPRFIYDPSSTRLRLLQAIIPGWLRHGWYLDNGVWRMADYVDFNEPTNRVRREGFEEWSLAALDIVRTLPLGLPPDVRAKAIDVSGGFSDAIDSIAHGQWRVNPIPGPVY